MFSITLASLAFFLFKAMHHRASTMVFSDRRSNVIRILDRGRTLVDVSTHNLISKPHFRVLRHWSLRDQSSTERSVRFGS